MELSLSVALVGVLGALGTYSVRRYVAQAYTAEAIQTVGGIRRAAMLVAELNAGKEDASSDPEPEPEPPKKGGKGGKGGANNGSSNGAEVTHGVSGGGLCTAAEPVPEKFDKVRAAKYQPTGEDYASGSATDGWRCLRFSISSPQAYQYGYDLGGPKVSVELPHGGSPPGLEKNKTWTAWARGDRDGDGKVSWFIMTGAIVNGTAYAPPAVSTVDELE